MVRTQDVEEQLKRIGVNFQFFGRPELRELPHILIDGEQIEHVVRGRYEGGWAILCATDRRVLLIDKKPFYLTLEDMRYDMIADVEYNHRMIDATIRLGTVNKTLRFTAYNHGNLRLLTSFVQGRVMASRQQPQSVFQQQIQQAPQPAQLPVPQYEDIPVSEASTGQMLGQSAIQGILTQPAVPSPYGSMPVMIRRRVSRFY